ncbi:MAG: type II secretion system F family protein [Patescibacteria group bacterium]
MKFKYSAKTKEGELQTGFVEAGSRDAAVNILAGHNLFILSMVATEKSRWYDRFGRYFGGVGRKDMLVFTRQLATLLEARLSLNEGLKTLSGQVTHPILKEAVFQITQDIDAGLAFSQALERQSGVFSNFFVSMVRSAEVTGNLDEVVGFLADYYEKEFILVSKARSALIYPVIVIGLFIIVAGVMVTVVFPQLQPIFEQSGIELPIYSRILINTGQFVNEWWFMILIGLIVLVSMFLNYLQTPEGRAFGDDMKLRLPIMRKVYLPLSIARFSNAASILLKGGVPVSQAMEIVSHTVDNVLYQDLLHEAAESVRQGEPLSQAISRSPDYFPPLVSQMLVVGETTGQLDKIFVRLSTFYNREADNVINSIVDLIQPGLMIGIGLLVGLLFASVLLPIYQLTANIQ